MQTLRIQIDDNDTRATIVRLDGEGHLDAGADLRHALRRVAQNRPPIVIIDLAGLSFAGSVVMGALMEMRSMCQTHGGAVKLAAASGHVAEALGHARLDRALPIYTCVQDALVND